MYLPCSWSLRSLPQVEARCTMRRFLLYVHRQVPRKSAPCLAHSWVRQLGVFGCRVVSPGSAIGIGSVKCERVWDSLRALESKLCAVERFPRWDMHVCPAPARKMNISYVWRGPRRARLATPEQQGGSAETTTFDLNDCYTITMAGYVLSMVRSFSGYQRAEI